MEPRSVNDWKMFPTIVSIVCKGQRGRMINLERCSDGRKNFPVVRGDEVMIRRQGFFYVSIGSG